MPAAEESITRSPEVGVSSAILLLILISDPLQALQTTGLAPALTTLKQHFDATGNAFFGIQMLVSLPGLGIILAGWPAGRLIERFGAPSVLTVALPAYAFSGAAGLVFDTLQALLLSRLLMGLATGAIASAALSLIAESLDPQQRPWLLSWQASLGAIAGLASLPVAGWLAETEGWRGPFALYLLALLAWPAALSRLQGGRLVRPAPHPANALPRASSRPLWPVLAGVALVFAAVFTRSSFLPFVLAEAGLTRPIEQAWTLALECLLNSLGALAFASFVARLAPARCLLFCLLIMGGGNLLLGLADSLPLKIFGMSISAAASGFAGPCLAYLVLQRAGPALQLRASGLIFTAIYLGDFIHPLPATLLRQAFGLHGAFVAVGLVCLAAGPLMSRRMRERKN